MNQVFIIVRKEMKEIINNKIMLILGLIVALTFIVLQVTVISKAKVFTVDALSNRVFNMSLFMGLFLGCVFSAQIFLREKQEGIIETLLCAPVNLRSIWLGKVIAATILTYLISLLSLALLIIIINVISPSFLFPSSAVIFHILVGVSVFITLIVGLIGFFQFLLAKSQALMATVFIAGGLYIFVNEFTRYIIGENDITSWTGVGVFLIICLALLAITIYLAKILSKEKIVTTIP